MGWRLPPTYLLLMILFITHTVWYTLMAQRTHAYTQNSTSVVLFELVLKFVALRCDKPKISLVYHKALFGCAELISGIELSGNSKSKVERKWLTIRILLFGWLEICCWNQRVVPISNSCLDVETIELDVLFWVGTILNYVHYE
jgi:hypothetical protein